VELTGFTDSVLDPVLSHHLPFRAARILSTRFG
jgi:hypothetical protein